MWSRERVKKPEERVRYSLTEPSLVVAELDRSVASHDNDVAGTVPLVAAARVGAIVVLGVAEERVLAPAAIVTIYAVAERR